MANVIKPENRRGLVGNWKYHGNVFALGTWYDISGNGNNGTLVDNAFVDNQGVNLDGSGDYVNLPIDFNSEFNTKPSLTFSAWIKRNSTGSRQAILDITIDEFDSIVFMEFQTDNTIRLGGRAEDTDSFQSVITTSSITDNNLHYIVGIIDIANDNIVIYIDGVEQSTTGSPSWSANSFNTLIGTRQCIGVNANLTYYFNGTISDIQIFHRALSAEEIKHLYHTTRRH